MKKTLTYNTSLQKKLRKKEMDINVINNIVTLFLILQNNLECKEHNSEYNTFTICSFTTFCRCNLFIQIVCIVKNFNVEIMKQVSANQ